MSSPPALHRPENLGRGRRLGAWHFAPCVGIWQGLVNPVLVTIPTILLKSMGVSNAVIGYASLATLPMAIKFVLGPMIDAHRTRRWWILRAGEGVVICVTLLGLSLMLPTFSMALFLAGLVLLAGVKSVQEIALKGFFTLSLSRAELALFSGLDAVFGRAATVLTASVLLAVAGFFGEKMGDARVTWGIYFGGLVVIFSGLYFYTRKMFPFPLADCAARADDVARPRESLREIIRGYLALPAIGAGLSYLFFLRSGETFLAKMGTVFLMDGSVKGGLGLSISEVGLFTGAMTGCAIAGGAISGFMLKRFGLRRVIWPFTAAATGPNFIYVYLALHNISGAHLVSFDVSFLGLGHWKFDWMLLALLGLENLGFGLGFTIMNYYMFRLAAGTRYPATYVAFNASVIYFSYMLFGAVSGVVQEAVGYAWLFTLSVAVSLPAFVAIPFLDYNLDQREKK